MLPCLSTHLFLKERLHPGLLELAERCGAQSVEIFAARQHFDYTSREHVEELANWFASSTLTPWSMHAPMFPDREMGRAGAPSVNLIHPDKSRRIDGIDEVKRALETAEALHFQNLIVHLGDKEDTWSPRTLEHGLSALEHLDAFASPLGVRILVENLTSDPTSPEHLMEILRIGHLDRVGVCLDLGHAHITAGISDAVSTFGNRIVSVHVHDNKGFRDEHLWPGQGNIDWPETRKLLANVTPKPVAVLELSETLNETHALLEPKLRAALAELA